jgi:hypothetical protein
MERTFVPGSILFGQFLLDQKKTTKEILEQALKKQSHEDSLRLRESHRLLGQILLDDFGVFESRVELNHFLTRFNEFKSEMERIMFEARTYGHKEKG